MRIRSGFVGVALAGAAFLAWGQPASPEQRQVVATNVRALGWAPYSAELSLVDKLPRPPRLPAQEASKGCEPTAAAFASPEAEAAWKKRRPARVLTIWGVAHYGSRAASKGDAGLCQDLVFLSRQWQAALGRPATGQLTEKDVAELARAMSDAEWGRPTDFGRLTVGLDPSLGPGVMVAGTTSPARPPALATTPTATPDAAGRTDEVDTQAALAVARGLAAAIESGPASVEPALRETLYYLPLTWLVMNDAWQGATREEKRELLGYLRQLMARSLLGAYSASAERDGKSFTISAPRVFKPGPGDTAKPARRLDALCAYVRLRNRCHAVRVDLSLGKGVEEPLLMIEMIPAQDREPGYQIVNIDIMGISLTDAWSAQLQGKSTAEALALLKRAAAPKAAVN